MAEASRHYSSWRPRRGGLIPPVLVLLVTACEGIAFAQNSIVPDSTLSSPTVVNRVDAGGITTYNISGGSLRHSNQLLFHSFSAFGLRPNEVGSFLNGSSVQTIFSRVTGGSPSQIDGLIKSQGSSNLYLINPQGIIFGATGAIQVGGSFVATTASALNFGGQIFAATAPFGDAPLITSNVTPGLQFGSGVAKLKVAGTLKVESGKTILLAGGPADSVEVSGSLLAPTGSIEITGGDILVGSATGRTILLAGNGSLSPVESPANAPNLTLLDGGNGAIVPTITLTGGANKTIQVFSGSPTPSTLQAVTTLRGATELKATPPAAVTPTTPPAQRIVLGGVLSGSSVKTTSTITLIDGGTVSAGQGGAIDVNGSSATTIRASSLSAKQGTISVEGGQVNVGSRSGRTILLAGSGTLIDKESAAPNLTLLDGGSSNQATISIRAGTNKAIQIFSGATTPIDPEPTTTLRGSTSVIGAAADPSTPAIHQIMVGGVQAGIPVVATSTTTTLGEGTSLRADGGRIVVLSSDMTMANGVISANSLSSSSGTNVGRIVMGGRLTYSPISSTYSVTPASKSTILGTGSSLTANGPGGIDVVSSDNTTSSGSLAADQGTISLIGRDTVINAGKITANQAGAISIIGSSTATLSGGSLQASGGSIAISGTNSTSLANTTLNADRWANGSNNKTGRIVVGGRLSGDSATPTSKTSSLGSGSSLTANGGGSIDVVSSGSTSSSGTLTATQGSISLNGPALTINGGALDAAAGSINLNGTTAVINAGSLTANQGGVIAVNGTASILMSNSRLNAQTSSSGLGGDIKISGQTVSIRDDSVISSQTPAAGNGGQISLTANTITLDTRSTITTQTTGTGRGASVGVQANNIVLDGGSKITTQAGIFNSDGSIGPATASGPAGNIRITAAGPKSLHVLNGSAISTSTNSSQPFRDPADLGGIEIRTPYFELKGSGSVSTNTFSAAQGGNIMIAADRADLNNGSRISAVSTGIGQAGNIDLFISQNLSLCNRCAINTSTTAFPALPPGANITILVGGDLLLLGNSSITASASGFATGGTIKVQVGGNLLRSPKSFIKTSAMDFAISGKVYLNIANGSLGIAANVLSPSCFELDAVVSPDVIPALYSSSLVPVSEPSSIAVHQLIINPANILDQSCSPNDDRSSFQTCGRGGVPTLPGDSPGRRPPLDDLGPPPAAPQLKPVPATRSSPR